MAVARSTAEQVDQIGSMGDQGTGGDEASLMNDRRCIPGYNQHSIRSVGEDSVVDLARRRSD